MGDQGQIAGKQPDFAWIPESKGLAKLFMGPSKRQAAAEGRSLRIFVFGWGIGWIDGDKEIGARWHEITHLWQAVTRHSTNGVATHTDYRYTVRLASGQSRAFSGSLSARAATQSQATRLAYTPGGTTAVTIEQLGRLLTTGVTRAQLPKAIECFNAGRPVSFGPLTVSPAGIALGDKSLSWSEIQGVRTAQGMVSVKKSGKWLAWKTVQVSKIPNYFVFDALVHAILAQQPTAGK
jgi:hypothetical protein